MADRQTREAFVALIKAVEEQRDALPHVKNKDAINFTLNESKTAFLNGEEHLGLDVLVDNLYQFQFPITAEIYTAILEVAQLVRYPEDQVANLRENVR